MVSEKNENYLNVSGIILSIKYPHQEKFLSEFDLNIIEMRRICSKISLQKVFADQVQKEWLRKREN